MNIWGTLRRVDTLVLRGIVSTTRRRFLEARVRGSSDFRIEITYDAAGRGLLTELFERYGSDKGSSIRTNPAYPWRAHTYSDFYELVLGGRRQSIQRVFECGIGTNDESLVSSMRADGKPGASLRAWRDFFPNAEIHGADIDPGTLFEEERIQTHLLDQLNPAQIAAMWERLGSERFDLMIDDGLHEFNAGRCLFENSVHMLKTDGIYIIEDVFPGQLLAYQEFFRARAFDVQYVQLFTETRTPSANALIMIQRRRGEVRSEN